MAFHHFSFLAFCIFFWVCYFIKLPFSLLFTFLYTLPPDLSSESNTSLLFSHSKHIYPKKMEKRQEGRCYSHKIFPLCKVLKKMHKKEFPINVTEVVLDCLMSYFSMVLAILFSLMKFFWKSTLLVPHHVWEELFL